MTHIRTVSVWYLCMIKLIKEELNNKYSALKLEGMKKLKSNSKSILSYACVCILISLVALSSLSTRINASTQIICRHPSYDGAPHGGGGEYFEAISYRTGYHRVYCRRDSWGAANVYVVWTHNKGTFTKLYIKITGKDAYVKRNYPWGSKAEAKFCVWLTDVTDWPQVLFEDCTRDYYEVQGLFTHNYNVFSVTLQNGHTYRLEAGAYVETGYGWFGYYGSAEARGTIDTMIVDADT
jgi:hypothetical protein